MKRVFSIIFFSMLFLPFSLGQTTDGTADEYEAWIKPNRTRLLNPGFEARAAANEKETPLALIAIVTENTGPGYLSSGTFTNGYVAKRSGEVEWFARTSMGSKGGCCGQMSGNEIVRAKELLVELPPDGSRLPPNGRRLLVQRPGMGSVDARVYDLAFLPDTVLELLRITKTRIKAYIPSFAPEIIISESLPFDLSAFAIAGDARFAVSTRGSEILRIRRSVTTKDASQEFQTVPLPQNVFVPAGLTLSPDESTLIAGGWGKIVFYDTKTWRVTTHVESPMVDQKFPNYTRHHFIDGGKYLLFETGEFGIRVFDTATWREVSKPRSIPDDALYYYDSPDSRRALYQAGGNLFLRKGGGSTKLLTLAEDKFEKASFSPDGTRIAVLTAGLVREGDSTWRHVRIRVWDAKNGKWIHELRPYERESCESINGVDWTRDGKYFLAATKSGGFFSDRGIAIWDADSGRNIAELKGCDREIFGMRVLSGGDKVAAGCGDNRILIWDLRASLAEIERFRKSGIAVN